MRLSRIGPIACIALGTSYFTAACAESNSKDAEGGAGGSGGTSSGGQGGSAGSGGSGGTGTGEAGAAGAMGGEGGEGGEGGGVSLPDCDERTELTNQLFVGGLVLEAGTCWSVNQNLTLSDGTVTVEEGVSVWFTTGTGVSINSGGQLEVRGTAVNPVEFATDDPLVTWKGIRMTDSQGSDNVWEYLVIGNAGADGWTGAAYSAAAVYLAGSTTLAMDRVTIEGSEGHGLLAQRDVSFTFSNGSLTNNDTPAYVHPNAAHGIGGETEFSDNANDYVSVAFGNADTVEADQSWAALGVPWRVQARFFVEADLTLEPGATLEFEQDVSMNVRQLGGLTAQGSADEPITFRAASAGTRGYWRGISLAVGGTDEPLEYGAVFDHVVFEDAGSSAWSGNTEMVGTLYMNLDSSALITNSTFRNSARYGLIASNNARLDGFAGNVFEGNARVMYLHPNRLGDLSGTSSIVDNDADRVHVAFGNSDTVDIDATWKNLGVPYEITSRFFIDAAVAIEEGASFEFAQDVRAIVQENGSLTTNGTADAPVTFSGVNEVDTGYWLGIQFQSNSPDNSLSNTLFQYTGSDLWTGNAESDAAIAIASGAQLTLSDVAIGPGGGYGVFLAAADSMLTCSGVTFTGLADGAIWDNAGGTILDGCN